MVDGLDAVLYQRRSKDGVAAADGDRRVDHGLDDGAAKKNRGRGQVGARGHGEEKAAKRRRGGPSVSSEMENPRRRPCGLRRAILAAWGHELEGEERETRESVAGFKGEGSGRRMVALIVRNQEGKGSGRNGRAGD